MRRFVVNISSTDADLDIYTSTAIQDTHLAVCLALVPHAVPHGAHDDGVPGPHPVARAVPALEVVLLGRVLDGDLSGVHPQVSAGVGGGECPSSIYRNIYTEISLTTSKTRPVSRPSRES